MHNDKRILTYMVALLAFFILIFFTKGAYSNLQVSLSEKSTYTAKAGDNSLLKAQETLNNLNDIKSEMEDSNNEINQEISKYLTDFSEDELLSYFYGYAEDSKDDFKIKSLGLSAKDINEYGFKEGIINLSISISEQETLTTFLRAILSDKGEYRFFIDKISIPEKREGQRMDVVIPLKIFYK